MIIRKLFKFEGAHIVRDCSSDYCKKSIHGHSYIVEIFLTADKLDNGCMIVDFGLLKTTVKDFIESFDHAWSYWDRESKEYQDFVHENSERYVHMPISPSAEGYSLMMFYVIDKIIKNTEFQNGETNVTLTSVRVHETTTGYAECFREDLEWWNYGLEDIFISPGIKKDWKNPDMWVHLIERKPFINPVVETKFQ